VTGGVRRQAVVDLSAVRSALTRSGLPLELCTADLRADAYGHGLVAVARCLAEAGVAGLLVSRRADLEALRDADVPLPADVEPALGRPLLGPAIFGLDPTIPTSPALRLEGEIISVKRVSAGRGVSYGYTYRTTAPTTLVLVALGFADGILRAASNTAPVQVGGRRARISGRIAMDQFMVDVGDEAPVVGDRAVLFGDGSQGEPTVHDWATALGVPAPAITSRLGRRIDRSYVA
jgi:alanine racemase